MLFNSIEFFIFFTIVFGLYAVLSHRLQNRMLLLASYVFYGMWDWRFLFLLFFSTVVDYLCGLQMHAADDQGRRRRYLLVSLAVNLGVLGFFKYFNFFLTGFADMMSLFGLTPHMRTLNIILPVGISFYTFQTLSYTIDIYRKKPTPTRHFLDFALYVSFFPQLVAGPIERASHLLPQMLRPRTITAKGCYEGLFLIIWGLYQKMFIADNMARFVDPVFEDPYLYSPEAIWLSAYAFAFQIYCDFAGYSNIARGLGRMMGFDIMSNFHVPYAAINPKEFWLRWHISLSTWLKDYLYIPLGGNRHGRFQTCRNLLVTMLLGGLWHGANWTFLIWGAFHGLLLIIYRLIDSLLTWRKVVVEKVPALARILLALVFFHFVCVGWIFFRAPDVEQAWWMIGQITAGWHFPTGKLLDIVPYLYLLILMDYWQHKHQTIFAFFRLKRRYQTLFLLIITTSLALGGIEVQEAVRLRDREGPREFIYFQF